MIVPSLLRAAKFLGGLGRLLPISAALCGLGPVGMAADKPLLLIVDLSRNFNTSDPHSYTVDAVQLAVATLRAGKAMEVIGFSDDASVLSPWNGMPTLGERQRVRDLLAERLQFTGTTTHYLAGLKLAWSELDQQQAPPGTRTIFFADAPPTDEPAAILAEAEEFAERGWIIDSVQLVAGADPAGPTLEHISDLTRGNHQEVNDANNLIAQFVAETSEENDLFQLDVHEWPPGVPVTVPAGTDRFSLLNVNNTGTAHNAHRGDFIGFALNGTDLALDEQTSYRYPRADLVATAGASLGCTELFAPAPGTYTASFDGRPRTVYISLALGARVQILPIPEAVDEGATITPGVSLVVPNLDPGVLDALAGQVAVTATINDGPATVMTAQLQPQVRSDRVVYSTDWRVLLPAGPIDRVDDHRLTVRYHVVDQGIYHLFKHDAFKVHPHPGTPPPPPPPTPVKPPEPVAVWAAPSVNLQPCWTDQGGAGALTLTTSGPNGTLTFAGGDGFSFPAAIPVPGTAQLPFVFRNLQGGHHHGSFSAVGHPAMTTPDLGIDDYPWAGHERLALAGAGPTGLPGWSPGAAGLAPQPLQALTAQLSSESGATVAVSIDAAGVASFDPAADKLASGVYSGAAVLHFGSLPPRSLAISLTRTRQQTVMQWGQGQIHGDDPQAGAQLEGGDGPIRIHEPKPGVWRPAGYVEAKIPMTLQSGMPGTWSVVLHDLNGPEGETLSATYDLRAAIDQPHLAAGDVTNLHVRVLRPRKMPGGEYRGSADIVFTPDAGTGETFSRAVVVTLP